MFYSNTEHLMAMEGNPTLILTYMSLYCKGHTFDSCVMCKQSFIIKIEPFLSYALKLNTIIYNDFKNIFQDYDYLSV